MIHTNRASLFVELRAVLVAVGFRGQTALIGVHVLNVLDVLEPFIEITQFAGLFELDSHVEAVGQPTDDQQSQYDGDDGVGQLQQ
jgi:hypothetical protein